MENLRNKVESSAYMSLKMNEWRVLLADECGVYTYNESYIAKRFDSIQYSIVGKETAKEILIDNLYSLLRFKYFQFQNDEIDKLIDNIVKNFTTNLKTTLIRVAFDWERNTNCKQVKSLNNSCLAFRNGVFDFKTNNWLFKYEQIKMAQNYNILYLYDPSYIIFWYIDVDFTPLDFDIMKLDFENFISIFKNSHIETNNYCYKLVNNMSMNSQGKYEQKRLEHFLQIMGFTITQRFLQYFVMLIGSGRNGKNSLIDGCLTPFIVPKPASNSLAAIEEDRFITGALENRYHNFFLETEPKIYTKSTMLKLITGSPYQTIENKGINKYSSMLNVKMLFSGNDQDKIKFDDNTEGFKRRINMFEIFYKWDSDKKYLKNGDYLETSFSTDLREIKNNIVNTITFIYLGMYGIMLATEKFTKEFEFSHNEYKDQYTTINTSLLEQLTNLTLNDLKNIFDLDSSKASIYSVDGKRLYLSNQYFSVFEETSFENFSKNIISKKFNEVLDNDSIYLNIAILKKYLRYQGSQTSFTLELKKIYNIDKFKSFYRNQPYIELTTHKNKLKFVKQ